MSAEPFVALAAVAAPIHRPNVDTDQIAPVRFLRRPRGDGYGTVLFHDLRFQPDGTERTDFVLNRPGFREARILVADENFGVGSSREQAVWALVDHGIRCVIAASFGDIFFNNAINHGLLLIREQAAALATARQRLDAAPGTTVAVDLEAQTWRLANQPARPFEIEAARKRRLLSGLDEIDMTRQLTREIEAFEAGYRARRGWLFRTT